jgi:hypothetical protein
MWAADPVYTAAAAVEAVYTEWCRICFQHKPVPQR